MKGICPNCEKITEIELISRVEKIMVRKIPIEVQVEYFHCEECGVEFRDPKSTNDPLDSAYSEYRKQFGLLMPEEIKAFRKRFGFTQRELADLLGWGAVTLSRYENGALQDEAHDTSLRLAMDHEALLQLIQAKKGVLSDEKRKTLAKSLVEIIKTETSSLRALFESSFGDYEADEWSGYRTFDIAKLLNSILYFCYRVSVPKTKLNKLLFYIDFKHFKDYILSITGSRYAHLPYGPAPDNYQHYIALLHHDECAIGIEERDFNDFSGEYLTSLKEPNLNVFSPSELKVLSEIKEKFSEFSSTDLSNLSHEELGYKETKDGDLISYEYAQALSI